MKKQNDKIFIARELRKNMTPAEKKLWKELRLCKLDGFRFRRQALIGTYVADFICHDAGVVIEVDGGQHNEENTIIYDQANTPHPNLPPQGGKGRAKLQHAQHEQITCN